MFNAEQVEGYEIETSEPETKSEVEILENVEQYIKNTGASIHHGGSRAFFTPSRDEIHMPKPEQFKSTGTSTAQVNYYGTLLHELIHWTGYKDRLNRIKGKSFGDNDYAFEELVAELTSMYLSVHFGLAHEPTKDNATYLNAWIKGLGDDETFIWKASSEAMKAVKYLMKLTEKEYQKAA